MSHLRDNAARAATPQPVVLLVDDDEDVLGALSDYFELNGWRVVTALSGEDALQRHTDEIDVVISDFAMRGMSGDALYRALRARVGDRLRFLLITATALASEPWQLGAEVRVIGKPFDPAMLVEAAHSAIERDAK